MRTHLSQTKKKIPPLQTCYLTTQKVNQTSCKHIFLKFSSVMAFRSTLDKLLCEPDKAEEGTQQPLNTEAGCTRHLSHCIRELYSHTQNKDCTHTMTQRKYWNTCRMLYFYLLHHYIKHKLYINLIATPNLFSFKASLKQNCSYCKFWNLAENQFTINWKYKLFISEVDIWALQEHPNFCIN